MSLNAVQLRFLATVCEALDKLEEDHDTATICLGSLPIIIGDFVVGECRDDYGNGYLFIPFDSNEIKPAI